MKQNETKEKKLFELFQEKKESEKEKRHLKKYIIRMNQFTT